MTVPSVQLSDGYSIPQIGLGNALDDQAIMPVIVRAIEAGFRHIDTAYRYGNQRGVGQGLRCSDRGCRGWDQHPINGPPAITGVLRQRGWPCLSARGCLLIAPADIACRVASRRSHGWAYTSGWS
jgi:hypothetical protein